MTAHKVVPTEDGGHYDLDHENLLSVNGPGCYKCEKTYSAKVDAAPCTGSLD